MTKKITFSLIVITSIIASTASATTFSKEDFYSSITHPKTLTGGNSTNFIKKIKNNCTEISNKDFPSNRSYLNIYQCKIQNENYTIGLNEENSHGKIISNYFGLITSEKQYPIILKRIRSKNGKEYSLNDTKKLKNRIGWNTKINSENSVNIEIAILTTENKTYLQANLEDNSAP